MARRGVIVRRLAAVEGLGSCTLIGSDKTGTLTCNELIVREVRLPNGDAFEVTGEGFAPEGQVHHQGAPIDSGHRFDQLARVAVLCNEADLRREDGVWVWRGGRMPVYIPAPRRPRKFAYLEFISPGTHCRRLTCYHKTEHNPTPKIVRAYVR